MRILEHKASASDVVQFLVSTQPHVSPSQIIWSVKGRLQRLIRDARPKAFRRKYSIHSIGSAKRELVEGYVADQLGHHRMADERVQRELARFQIENADLDLSSIRSTAHGRFIYNVHLVLVNAGRWREVREDPLARTREMLLESAKRKGHLLSNAAILADHLHLTIGCETTESPLQVALGYMNNLAYAHDMVPILEHGFYVGTFGEYDLAAIRRRL